MVNDEMLAMAENTGKKPNFCIMAPDVFYALKNHDAIMDRIKYTQRGVITAELLLHCSKLIRFTFLGVLQIAVLRSLQLMKPALT